MRTITKAAALVAMLAIPGAAFAAQATTAPAAAKKTTAAKPAAQPAAKPAAKTAAPAAKKSEAVAKHTTSGTVKSATDSSLVISKGGKDQTFVVNSTTEKKGTVEPGAKVAVHYTVDGKSWVATAITAHPAKAGKKSKDKK